MEVHYRAEKGRLDSRPTYSTYDSKMLMQCSPYNGNYGYIISLVVPIERKDKSTDFYPSNQYVNKEGGSGNGIQGGTKSTQNQASYLVWESEKHTKIPSFHDLEQNPDAKFLHICANENIHGVEYKDYPSPKNGILVADMSSNFYSKPVDVSKFGFIYAGAQKNVGPSGVTVVIIKKDLIGNDGIYMCPVEKSVRSSMNVPFTLQNSGLEAEFIKGAAKENMVELRQHKSIGGMRASIYNAMPLAAVEKLVAFMKDFQARFHDLADRVIEEKDKEISKLLDGNKDLHQSLKSKPPVDHNGNHYTAMQKQDARNLSTSVVEQ
nr:phosphoserine aminotransferase 1, chloroplastic [Quercus suber]